MPLSPSLRLERLNDRTAELHHWRDRAAAQIGGWTIDGAPIARGDAWPHRQGVLHFSAVAEVPNEWPTAEARLQLDLGGESLVTLCNEAGEAVSFGVDP